MGRLGEGMKIMDRGGCKGEEWGVGESDRLFVEWE